MSQQTSHSQLMAAVAVLIILTVGGVGYYLGKSGQPGSSYSPTPTSVPGGNGQVACTMEAKICPDGSSVGRQGPNCEFAACPGEKVGKPSQPTQSSQIYTGKLSNFTVSYPYGFTAEFINIPDNTDHVERVVFKRSTNGAGEVSSFQFIADPRVAKISDSSFYGQGPTGKYTLNNGVEGVYASLPQGYTDGPEVTDPPTPVLSFIFSKPDRQYIVTFYGTSELKNPVVHEVLKNLKF